MAGGVKINVIPSEAHAFINFRIHPAQPIRDVIQHCKDVVDDDRVKFKIIESFLPSRVSDYSADAKPFQIVVNSALEV
jgi:carboxypeptidase PM20D1